MKILIALITLSIILTGCSPQKDSFSRKKDCQELYDVVLKKMESKWGINEWNRLVNWWSWRTDTGLQIEDPQIYYSEKLWNCIYKTEIISSITDARSESVNYIINIVDIFSNKDIAEINCTSKTSWFDEKYGPQYTFEDMKESSKCLENVDKKLKELEVE